MKSQVKKLKDVNLLKVLSFGVAFFMFATSTGLLISLVFPQPSLGKVQENELIVKNQKIEAFEKECQKNGGKSLIIVGKVGTAMLCRDSK